MLWRMISVVLLSSVLFAGGVLAAGPVDVLRNYLIKRVEAGAPLKVSVKLGKKIAKAELRFANENMANLKIGKMEMGMSWHVLGEEGIYLLCKPGMTGEKSPEVLNAYLQLAVKYAKALEEKGIERLVKALEAADAEAAKHIRKQMKSAGKLAAPKGVQKKASKKAKEVVVEALKLPEGSVRQVALGESIQQVVDTAKPGDVIVLEPGVYYQKVTLSRSGTVVKPIYLCARVPGKTTISGCPKPDFRLSFEEVGGGIYKANIPWKVRWVMADSRNLLRKRNLSQLKSNKLVPEGFAWENNVLYVKLLGNQDANKAKVEIHRADADVNISVQGSYVVVQGLRLHMAPDTGVRVNGRHVTIRDCFMDGAYRGILHGRSRSPNLVVEYCEFSGFPNYQWHRENYKRWKPMYDCNLSVTFISGGGPGWKIRHNFIYECFDGIQTNAPGSSDPRDLTEYSYNLVMNAGDDAVEFDSREFLNLRFHHNFIMDGMALLAISPVAGGGLMIDHNIGYTSPEYGKLYCPIFKFGTPWGNKPTSKGVTIVHNTLINRRGVPHWSGRGPRFKYEDMVLENNILEAAASYSWNMPGFTPSPHNLYHAFNGTEGGWKKDLPGVIVAEKAIGFVSDTKTCRYDGNPATGQTPAFEGMDIRTGAKKQVKREVLMNFYLRGDSKAVDAGVENKLYHHVSSGKPDLGAIERGSKWEFPRPGPRWATFQNIPYRPPFSPSLDLEFIGFKQSEISHEE